MGGQSADLGHEVDQGKLWRYIGEFDALIVEQGLRAAS